MKQRRFTRKIGYTVLLTTALLILSVVGYMVYTEVRQAQTVTIRFPETGTLKIDNVFTLHGKKVGTIKKMGIADNGDALVTVELSYPLPIFNGYKVHVIDNGVFGERRIDLIKNPGEPKIILVNGSRDLGKVQPQDTLCGENLLGISDILGNMHEVRNAFLKVQKSMRETFEDAEGENKVFDFVDSAMAKIDRSTKLLYTFTSELHKDIEINLPEAIEKTNQLLGKIEDFSEKSSEIEDELETLLADAQTFIDSVSSKTEEIEKLSNTLDTLLDTISIAIEIDTIEKELINISNQIESIGIDAHKLKLLLNSYDK